MVERGTENPGVGGSTPPLGTILMEVPNLVVAARPKRSFYIPIVSISLLLVALLYYGFSGGLEYIYGMGDPPARELFLKKCSNHHSLWRLYTRNYRGEQWTRLVHRMQDKPGSHISSQEAEKIIKYFKKTRQ